MDLQEKICELMEEMGYNVQYKVLDASDYGVPQKRMRAVFVGIRNDIGKVDFNIINKYKVNHKTTVDEALCDLYEIEQNASNDEKNEVYSISKSISNDYLNKMHDGTNYIYNHRINYPNVDVQKELVMYHKVEIGKMFPKNYFHLKGIIDIQII